MYRWGTVVGIFLGLCLVYSTSFASEALEKKSSERESFIEEMVSKHGFDRNELTKLLARARVRRKILKIMTEPAEATKPWESYRSRFVNSERIQGGLSFLNENSQALVFARRAYGVPESITTAIIGVETGYGSYMGRHRVLDSLVTLAFNFPRRADDFRRELEHYLLLTREEEWSPFGVKGSPAGAIGMAQFMPTSYRLYGVDFDGDGKRDLTGNTTDAIGSVAHYFQAHGWEAGQPVVVPANVTEKVSSLPTGFDTRRSLDEWEKLGVTPLEDAPRDRLAMLIALETKKGKQYWLGFRNFYVITRYNRSTRYAMAVYQLGQEIESRSKQAAEATAPVDEGSATDTSGKQSPN